MNSNEKAEELDGVPLLLRFRQAQTATPRLYQYDERRLLNVTIVDAKLVPVVQDESALALLKTMTIIGRED